MKLIKLCAPAWMDKEYPKKAKERKLQRFYNFLKSKNIVIEFYHGTSDLSWELIQSDGMMSPPTWRSREKYEGRTKGLDKLFFTKHIPTAIRYANREVKSWDEDDRFQRYKEEKGINLDRKAEPVIIKKNVPLHYLDEIKGIIYGTSIYNETSSSNNIRNIILSEYSDGEKLSNILSLIEDSGENYSEFTIKGSVPISREEGFQHIEKMNSKDFWIKVLVLEDDPNTIESFLRFKIYYNDVPEELKNDPDILKIIKNRCIKYLQNNPSYYKYVPEELKNDDDILKVIKNSLIKRLENLGNPSYYKYVPEVLKLDKNILKVIKNSLIKRLEKDPSYYKYVPEVLKNDPDILKVTKNSLIKRLEKDPRWLGSVPEELKNDSDILQYAPKSSPKSETEEVTANNWYCLYKLTKKKEKFNLSKFAQGLDENSEENEEVNDNKFHFHEKSRDDKDKLYEKFKESYDKATGSSWDKGKFENRASGWIFYGDEDGYISVRQQNWGALKLTGQAGNIRSMLKGLETLLAEDKPTWGMVSADIANMATRKGFIQMPPFLLKALIKFIPSNVFGNAEIKSINSDGSITFNYSDVGEATKVFIGNKKYYLSLLGFNNIPRSAKFLIKKLI
jgi:hypothetical protein